MSKEISVNSMELVRASTNSQTAINDINVNLDEWVNQGENSIALQAFSEQFVEMEKVMRLYQKLLNQDVSSIKKIGIEFFVSDFNLAKLWDKK